MIVAVTEEVPRILSIQLGKRKIQAVPALPYGPLDVDGDLTLELGLRRWVREQTGINLGYTEQLYSFGDRNRNSGESRTVSVAYLALIREQSPKVKTARWSDWYSFLPWEDWRKERPTILDEKILPALEKWMDSSPQQRQIRRERIDVCFGSGGARWNWERALERYELLFEAKLVSESWRENPLKRTPNQNHNRLGEAMFLDHRRIIVTALDRIRGKLRYRPVIFELLPPQFTLLELQKVVEALEGFRIHKQNFRRLIEQAGLVEGTSSVDLNTGGRPAKLFRFRREVLRERPTPGVGLPGIP